MKGLSINDCQAGHITHTRKTVKSLVGDILIYDYQQYMGFAGYCMGQDSVSETIERTKSWDIDIHNKMEFILSSQINKPHIFFDVGAHIGYFSMLGAKLGCEVYSFEGNPENFELLKINAPSANATLLWYENNMGKATAFDKKIKLIKIDIEGAEQYAIEYFEGLFEKRLVENVIIEISPTFNDSYPALIEKMVSKYGFVVFELDGSEFKFVYDFLQKDLWLQLKI